MYCRFILIALVCGLPTVPAFAQFEASEDKLTAADGSAYDEFGHSVSLSGDRAIIGAYLDNDQNGSAYIFERQADGTWQEVYKLTAGDGDAEDWFGYSTSLEEDRAIVGAWRDDDLGTESGSAYIFERQGDGSWQEVAKLTASGGDPFDFFGYSVSLSGDHAIVGARGEGGIFEVGAAYVFERQEGDPWQEVTKLTPTDPPDHIPFSRFGVSVSLSGDRAIVGASGGWHSGTASGLAFLYERDEDGTWLEVDELTASDADQGDRFGSAVSLSGDRVIVGAFSDDDPGLESGSAYIYERQSDGTWLEMTKLVPTDGAPFDHFGTSVSIDGDLAIVGSYLHDEFATDDGSAYMYEVQGDGSWLEVGEFAASDGTAGDRFGISVSLSGDRALVGAYLDDDLGTDSGSAYLYDDILTTAVEMSVDLPQGYLLSVAYPNPFNPKAQFMLEVAEPQHVLIEVFNPVGQRVTVLHDGMFSGRGTHPFTFEAGSLPNGVYLLRVTGETFSATRTMTLLK